MERKMKVKQHNKHGRQLHRPLDAYELYELEHMPNMLVKVPSYEHRPKLRAHGHEAYRHEEPPEGHEGRVFRPDYFDTSQPGGHNEKIFRSDYNYETGRTWHPPSDGRMFKHNIDAMAEKFIQLEHERFEPSKWM